jgi:hypothetical protein
MALLCGSSDHYLGYFIHFYVSFKLQPGPTRSQDWRRRVRHEKCVPRPTACVNRQAAMDAPAHHLTVYPRPSRHAARAFEKAACCCCVAACCCCWPCCAVAAFWRRLCPRAAAAPTAAPAPASPPTTSPTTAPRAAPRAPAPGVVPDAVVGGVAAACCGGGFAGSKPLCWTAHEEHAFSSLFCLSGDCPLAGYTACCALASASRIPVNANRHKIR